MTRGPTMGRSVEDAFRLGIAAGTAAVMTPPIFAFAKMSSVWLLLSGYPVPDGG